MSIKNYKKAIPHGWQLAALGSVADPEKRWGFTGGPFGSNLKQNDYTDEGVRIIQLQNIGEDVTDPERFGKAVDELGSDRSKAEAIAAHTNRTITERMDKDPEFYQRFSEKIQKVLENMHKGKISDAEALGQMRLIKDEVMGKKDNESPDQIQKVKGASIFYRNLQAYFSNTGISDDRYSQVVLGLVEVLQAETIVDWYKNAEVRRIIANRLDDYLYDVVKLEFGIDVSPHQARNIVDATINLAEHNHELFEL